MTGKKENIPFDILNLSGYNIGNFCLPFAQSFLQPLSLLGITLFDMGNAFYCNGGAKAVAEVFKNSIHRMPGTETATKTQLKNSLKTMGRALSRSTPFLVYFGMLIVLILGIPIPRLVLSVTQIGSNANAFTAMLMIGVGFKLNIKKRWNQSCDPDFVHALCSDHIICCDCFFLSAIPAADQTSACSCIFKPDCQRLPGLYRCSGGRL